MPDPIVAPIFYDPVAEFRKYVFVREHGTGQNHGVWVGAIQHIGLCQDGDSYCACGVCMVLDICTQLQSPFKRSGACQDFYDTAKANGWLVDLSAAEPGDLVLTVNAADHAHHIAMFTGRDAAGKPYTIAFNTSDDGASSNGDGCHEHELLPSTTNTHVVIHWPREAVDLPVPVAS